MSKQFPDTPLMGDMVYYFDEDKCPCVAFVAFVFPRKIKGSPRPICNLAIIKHDGRFAARVNVAPAIFDNSKAIWKVINRWAWPDEIPIKDLNPSLSDTSRMGTSFRDLVP